MGVTMAKSKTPGSAERRIQKASKVDRLMAAIANLSADEREDLLDRIEEEYPSFDPADIPAWHVELLKQRLANAKANPEAGIPLGEYLKKFRQPR